MYVCMYVHTYSRWVSTPCLNLEIYHLSLVCTFMYVKPPGNWPRFVFIIHPVTVTIGRPSRPSELAIGDDQWRHSRENVHVIRELVVYIIYIYMKSPGNWPRFVNYLAKVTVTIGRPSRPLELAIGDDQWRQPIVYSKWETHRCVKP